MISLCWVAQLSLAEDAHNCAFALWSGRCTCIVDSREAGGNLSPRKIKGCDDSWSITQRPVQRISFFKISLTWPCVCLYCSDLRSSHPNDLVTYSCVVQLKSTASKAAVRSSVSSFPLPGFLRACLASAQNWARNLSTDNDTLHEIPHVGLCGTKRWLMMIANPLFTGWINNLKRLH